MSDVEPKCKDCKSRLSWAGFASMGGSHSNYYKCRGCGRAVEIYDRDLRSKVMEVIVDGVKYKAETTEKEF